MLGKVKTHNRIFKKYSYEFLMLLIAISLILIGMFMIGMSILLISGIYFLLSKVFNVSKAWFWTLLFTIPVFFRLFIFEVRNVPSSSMEDALFPGDYVLVSKVGYSLPIAEFLGNNRPANQESLGLSEIKRNDVIVFKNPVDGKFLVKRIAGLPGDILKIGNQTLIINNHVVNPLPTVKFSYKIWTNDTIKFEQMAHDIGIFYNHRYEQGRVYAQSILNTIQKKRILNSPYIDSISYNPVFPSIPVFPIVSGFNWTGDNFGPVLIPKKGVTIEMNHKNYQLYRTLILNYEKTSLEHINGSYFIDKKKVIAYTFKQNYYFVMGDNHNYSVDSRFLGFVPESNIQGKVIYTLFSIDSNGWNWKRLMKPI